MTGIGARTRMSRSDSRVNAVSAGTLLNWNTEMTAEVQTAPKPPIARSAHGSGGGQPSQRRGGPVWLRISVSAVLVVLCLGAALQVFQFLASFKTEPPRDTPTAAVLKVQVFAVERATFRRYITSYGTARADRMVTVSAEVPGRVTETHSLRVGNRLDGPTIQVGSGGESVRREADVIVQIDPETYRERAEQADSLVRQDQSGLDRLNQERETNQELQDQLQTRIATARRELERRRSLLARGAGSESDVERADQELQQFLESKIRLDSEKKLFDVREEEIRLKTKAHENDRNLARLDLEKATVRAPFSGVLSGVFVEQGQYVRPGDKLVEISDIDVIEVPIALSLHETSEIERMIAAKDFPTVELARDQGAFLNPAETVWTGRIKRIAPTADERTRTIMVYAEVINGEQKIPLKPGTFVFARVQAGLIEASRGVLIPRDTIIGGQVFVVRESAVEREPGGPEGESRQIWEAKHRDVVVDETLQTFALVRSGLEPGERIVMTNLDIMTDGALLDVRDEHDLDRELTRLKVPGLVRIPDGDAGSR